ncbi:MAG: transketolase family protein [Clostridia bacterium]|nr:transketolase family protein [Clostridia bacterium]MBQ8972049.1 transketolase family protein [Clostridia bacterium]
MKVIYNGGPDGKTFKELFGEMVPAMLEKDPNLIYLDADLMSCLGTAKYAKAHPDRAINVGIAESNMAGIAAGLYAAGFKPICHTFGPFASRRCFDQVFMSAAYAKNDITMIGTDPGVTAAMNGGTHMPFEDVALYRSIPGATIIDAADTAQAENVFPKLVERKGVKYIRINRKANDLVYEAGSDFEIGKGVVLREGKDVTIVAAGLLVGKALKAVELLAEKGVEATVIDMFTIKPLDEALLVEYAKKTGCVVTAENHNKFGGLYSAVSEALGAKQPVPVGYVAVEDEFGEVGPADYLAERFGLTPEHIVQVAEETIARK